MESEMTYYFRDKLNQIFKNNIKLWLIFDEDENILIITKEDKVYKFNRQAINNSLLVFSDDQSIIEDKIDESFNEELSYKGIIDIKEGFSYYIALTFDGKLYSWGSNHFSVLGIGLEDWSLDLNEPQLLQSLTDKHIMEVCCGCSHTIALTIEGQVYVWGNNQEGQIVNRRIGYNECQSIPLFVAVINDEKVRSISSGSVHCIILTERGRVYSWGSNRFGQLGRNTGENLNSNTPKLIEVNEDIIFTKTTCGCFHTLLLSQEGDLFVFGRNTDWELGINTETDKQFLPIKLNNNQRYIDIATYSNEHFTSALSMNDLYYIWGNVNEVEIIKRPKQTEFKSFDNLFLYYFKFTFRAIKGEIIEFEDNFIRIGFFTKRFVVRELLGEGNYGKVFKVTNSEDCSEYAVKRSKLEIVDQVNDLKTYLKELENVAIISELGKDSEKIICYFDIWFEYAYQQNSRNIFFYLQMELCDKSLNDIMSEIKSNCKLYSGDCLTLLGFYISTHMFNQILEGLHYLHTRNPQIIHRDLTPYNILLSYYNESDTIIKIADFGLACMHKFKDQKHSEDKGNLCYAAPEVLDGEDYDTRADIYSIGVIMKELFLIDFEREKLLNKENCHFINKYHELYKLADKMTKDKANERPESCRQILKDKYMWILNGNELEVNIDFDRIFNDNEENDKESFISSLLFKLLEQKLSLHHASCGECNRFPIAGIRYKCIECEDYDICETCIYIKKPDVHPEAHKFKKYSTYFGCVDSLFYNPSDGPNQSIINVKFLYAFIDNVFVVTNDDIVYAFGDNLNGCLGFGHSKKVKELKIVVELCNKGIIEFKDSEYYTIARTYDGRLYCWGSNLTGGIGNGKKDEFYYKPQLNEFLSNTQIIEMSSGRYHIIVLTIEGKVYGWGLNDHGQIGNNNYEDQLTPFVVNEFNGEKVISISCGVKHSLALTKNGNVYSWGFNEYGQLGRRTIEGSCSNCPKPIELKEGITFTKISCGYQHSLLLSIDGDIYGFGSNIDEELGLNAQSSYQLIPIKLNNLKVYTDIITQANRRYSCAHSTNGFYYIWGKTGIFNEGVLSEPKETKFKSIWEIYFLTSGINSEDDYNHNFQCLKLN